MFKKLKQIFCRHSDYVALINTISPSEYLDNGIISVVKSVQKKTCFNCDKILGFYIEESDIKK